MQLVQSILRKRCKHIFLQLFRSILRKNAKIKICNFSEVYFEKNQKIKICNFSEVSPGRAGRANRAGRQPPGHPKPKPGQPSPAKPRAQSPFPFLSPQLTLPNPQTPGAAKINANNAKTMPPPMLKQCTPNAQTMLPSENNAKTMFHPMLKQCPPRCSNNATPMQCPRPQTMLRGKTEDRNKCLQHRSEALIPGPSSDDTDTHPTPSPGPRPAATQPHPDREHPPRGSCHPSLVPSTHSTPSLYKKS